MESRKKSESKSKKEVGELKIQLATTQFDLWEDGDSAKGKGVAEVPCEDAATIVMGPGLVLLKRFLNVREQQELVDLVRRDGLKENSGFESPALKHDRPVKLRSFCYGQQWCPLSHRYVRRADLPSLPGRLVEVCGAALLRKIHRRRAA